MGFVDTKQTRRERDCNERNLNNQDFIKNNDQVIEYKINNSISVFQIFLDNPINIPIIALVDNQAFYMELT